MKTTPGAPSHQRTRTHFAHICPVYPLPVCMFCPVCPFVPVCVHAMCPQGLSGRPQSTRGEPLASCRTAAPLRPGICCVQQCAGCVCGSPGSTYAHVTVSTSRARSLCIQNPIFVSPINPVQVAADRTSGRTLIATMLAAHAHAKRECRCARASIMQLVCKQKRDARVACARLQAKAETSQPCISHRVNNR